MHSSTRLTSTDFQYWQHANGGTMPMDFNALFPNYHEQDRAGVASLSLEDGVIHTGAALLAMTTSFYDILRARMDVFFDYPQHFAIIGASGDRMMTRQGLQKLEQKDIGSPWGWLDVWPDTNWIMADRTASGMLKQVFQHQVNRLFWPEHLKPAHGESRLPDYVFQMLSRRLKSVYYYDTSKPTVEIHAGGQGREIIQESILRLSTYATGEHPELEQPYVERYRQVEAVEFLETMAACFESIPIDGQMGKSG